MRCLVTGGARGIGLGIVKELLAQGASVGFCGRSSVSSELLQQLSSLPGRAVYFTCDVSSAGERQRLLEDFQATFGGEPHILVNNAGVAPLERCDITEMSEESFDRVMNINLKGPFFLTQEVARRMIASGDADGVFRCIVNISSISSRHASINRGEYCISKAGISMATRLWAVRLAGEGIPVYEVRPGVIHSDMTAGVAEKYDRLLEGGLALQRRWGEAADVGRAVAMLASGALSYSTGQVIDVDGGISVERL